MRLRRHPRTPFAPPYSNGPDSRTLCRKLQTQPPKKTTLLVGHKKEPYHANQRSHRRSHPRTNHFPQRRPPPGPPRRTSLQEPTSRHRLPQALLPRCPSPDRPSHHRPPRPPKAPVEAVLLGRPSEAVRLRAFVFFFFSPSCRASWASGSPSPASPG